jgi:hypothetical protein
VAGEAVWWTISNVGTDPASQGQTVIVRGVARIDPARAAGRFVRAVKSGDWKAKAKQGADSLKAEYKAGKVGEESAPTPIWPTPKEQLDRVLGLFRSPKPVPEDLDAEADQVAVALRGVDWAGVRAATATRTGDAARAARTMAAQVDWAKVQPVAARVSSALIAAVASGRLGVGGPLGSMVVRTIADQSGLAQRVAQNLENEQAPLPPDFRDVIDTTAREI